MAKKGTSVQLPKELITDLLEASLRFHEIVETLEVQLDKDTVRRLKRGEREYRQGKYKVASTRSGELSSTALMLNSASVSY